jgi:hypothetical protein
VPGIVGPSLKSSSKRASRCLIEPVAVTKLSTVEGRGPEDGWRLIAWCRPRSWGASNEGEAGGDSDGKEVKDLLELATLARAVEALDEAWRERVVTRAERRLDREVDEV